MPLSVLSVTLEMCVNKLVFTRADDVPRGFPVMFTLRASYLPGRRRVNCFAQLHILEVLRSVRILLVAFLIMVIIHREWLLPLARMCSDAFDLK